jgi:putative aldouronate transport system permease protein
MIRETYGERLFNVINIIFLSLLSLMTLYPILHVIFASLSSPMELIAHKGLLFGPVGDFTWAAYGKVFQNPNILSGYKITIIVVVSAVTLNILMTSIGAYFLSRKNVMWRNPVMFMIVFTMFFHGGMVPFYLLIKGLGMYNTLWALIIPGAINTFNLIIMRTAFMTIPDSIEESARIDGAGHFTILFRIIIPLALPVIAVMILYYGVHHWNAWFNAMLFLNDRNLFPLQLILREILILNDTTWATGGSDPGEVAYIEETLKYAIIVVATLPILCLYPFLQKYFVKGVLIGSLKE